VLAIGAIIWTLAGCAEAVAPAPVTTDNATPESAGDPVCVAPACDPVCVESGRYRATTQLVTDTAQGNRVWQRHVEARLPWEDAVAYCTNLTLEGDHGFRLPSPDELSGIRYRPGGLFGGAGSEHYCVPSIDQAAFPDTPSDQTWTSARETDDSAWYVDFADGRSHREVRTEALWVRCVRDGGSQ
jgi:hypothetical protein